MDQTIVFMLAGILIGGAILFALVNMSKKGTSNLDVEKYRSDWMSIEQRLNREETSSYHLAVLNADKLVDKAMRERGIQGQTMGERMKNGRTKFTNNDGFWSAHKLRNRIAHEPDVNVSYEEARHALFAFKQVLKDLGAI